MKKEGEDKFVFEINGKEVILFRGEEEKNYFAVRIPDGYTDVVCLSDATFKDPLQYLLLAFTYLEQQLNL